MKFCPKCGSTNLNFLSFFNPSIWVCLNCGYQGAFIIEDSMLAEMRAHCGHWNRIPVNEIFLEQPSPEPKVQVLIPMY